VCLYSPFVGKDVEKLRNNWAEKNKPDWETNDIRI
jgi:hypothetical protein